MAAETVEAKARRYLAEGRVQVIAMRGDRVRARCHGTTGVYDVEHEGAARWRCSCPATRWCSHVEAVSLVTTPMRSPEVSGG